MKIINKDITTIEHGIIIQGVNCQNVMGSGLAKAIYTKWPVVKQSYHEHCKLYSPKQLLGTYQAIGIDYGLDKNNQPTGIIVINLFSQLKYGHDGQRYASTNAIHDGINKLLIDFKDNPLQIYLPKIGCGLGGLSWEREVEPLLSDLEDDWAKNFIICEIDPNK